MIPEVKELKAGRPWILVIAGLVLVILILTALTARAQVLDGCKDLPEVGQNNDAFIHNMAGAITCVSVINGIEAFWNYFVKVDMCREGSLLTQAAMIHDFLLKHPSATESDIALDVFDCGRRKSTYTPWTGSGLYQNCNSQYGCGPYMLGFITSWWDARHVAERDKINGAIADKLNSVCFPEHATVLQAMKIVMQYLERNPEQLDQPAPELIYRAMRQAFPCSGGQPMKEHVIKLMKQ